MVRILISAALVACVLLLPRYSHAIDVEEGVVYATHDGVELKLDIATPGDGEMRPAVIFIHGGAWRGGSRGMYAPMIRQYAEKGYVAATISYRLTDVASWPAQMKDVQAAFDYLLEHADQYGIDTERIGVTGGSAGGHLSLMLGLRPSEQQNTERLRCIANFFGPADMTEVEYIEHARGVVEALAGGKFEEKLDVMTDASPVTHIDRTDPPVLTFHGDQDKVVHPNQADILHAALTKAQIPNRLEVMKGVGHGLGDQGERVFRQMDEFFAAYLASPDLPLVAHEDFDDGAARWTPTDTSAWKYTEQHGETWLALIKRKSDYQPKVRSPHNINLLEDVEVSDFVLEVDMRSTQEPYGHQSMCLFFGYQDPSHFYYVHFGREADAHANSIFLVNDAPRASIAQERTDGTDWSRGWHRVRIRREVESGLIEVYFDDMVTPVMKTIDKTFTHGQIGIGSFDDTGDFDAVRLWGRQEHSED